MILQHECALLHPAARIGVDTPNPRSPARRSFTPAARIGVAAATPAATPASLFVIGAAAASPKFALVAAAACRLLLLKQLHTSSAVSLFSPSAVAHFSSPPTAALFSPPAYFSPPSAVSFFSPPSAVAIALSRSFFYKLVPHEVCCVCVMCLTHWCSVWRS